MQNKKWYHFAETRIINSKICKAKQQNEASVTILLSQQHKFEVLSLFTLFQPCSYTTTQTKFIFLSLNCQEFNTSTWIQHVLGSWCFLAMEFCSLFIISMETESALSDLSYLITLFQLTQTLRCY